MWVICGGPPLFDWQVHTSFEIIVRVQDVGRWMQFITALVRCKHLTCVKILAFNQALRPGNILSYDMVCCGITLPTQNIAARLIELSYSPPPIKCQLKMQNHVKWHLLTSRCWAKGWFVRQTGSGNSTWMLHHPLKRADLTLTFICAYEKEPAHTTSAPHHCATTSEARSCTIMLGSSWVGRWMIGRWMSERSTSRMSVSER